MRNPLQGLEVFQHFWQVQLGLVLALTMVVLEWKPALVSELAMVPELPKDPWHEVDHMERILAMVLELWPALVQVQERQA